MQPTQCNLDVLLFPLDPQITTPAPLRCQERLPATAEWVQNQIASLAESLDQLFGKCEGKHRRMIKTPLIAANTGDDHIRDSSNAFT